MKLDDIARDHAQELEQATANTPVPAMAGEIRNTHGWSIALGAALLVVVAIGVSGLLGSRPDAIAPVTPTTTAPILAPAPAPISPVAAEDWPSFEMVFELSDGTFGRFIWANQDNWFIERRRWADGGISDTLYSSARRGDESTLEDPAGLLGGPTSEWPPPTSTWEHVPDPQALFAYLMNPQAAANLALDTDKSPSRPDTASIRSGPDVTVELSAEGVPIVVAPSDPNLLTITMTQLELRPIMRAELGRQILGDFGMIAYMAADSTPEQVEVLSKGFVLASEYQQALDSTIACIAAADPGTPAEIVGDPTVGPVEIATDSSAIGPCVAEHLDDIQALWRFQTVTLSEDETERLYYEVTGDTDALAVLDGQPGMKVTFPDLKAGFIEAYTQGPGICSLISLGSSSGHGCQPTSGWQVPEQLMFDVSYGFDNEEQQVGRVELAGFVPLEAVTVEILFTSGATELIPVAQPSRDFPYAAFTFSYDGQTLGFPDQVRALAHSGAELVNFDYRKHVCDGDAKAPLDSPLSHGLCSN